MPHRIQSAVLAALLGAFVLLAAAPSAAAQGDPNDPAFQAAVKLQQAGQLEEAAAAYRALVEGQPGHDLAWFNLGLCEHMRSDYDAAITAYQASAAFPRTKPSSLYNIACAHALSGRTDPALEALRQAVAAGFANFDLARKDTDLASIRDDERFEAILGSVGPGLPKLLHFWVGEWDCYSAKTGKLNGTNDLTARLNDKVIHELWTPVGGGPGGESWNYYNPTTGTWRQHWIDGNGVPFVFDGTPQGQGILYEGPVNDGKPNPNRRRMFIRPIGDGRVQQTGTVSNDNGKTWKPNYDLVYVPRGEAFVRTDMQGAAAPEGGQGG